MLKKWRTSARKSVTSAVDLGDKNSVVWRSMTGGEIFGKYHLEKTEKNIAKLFLNKNWGYGGKILLDNARPGWRIYPGRVNP
jgi:hypothetical protein